MFVSSSDCYLDYFPNSTNPQIVRRQCCLPWSPEKTWEAAAKETSVVVGAVVVTGKKTDLLLLIICVQCIAMTVICHPHMTWDSSQIKSRYPHSMSCWLPYSGSLVETGTNCQLSCHMIVMIFMIFMIFMIIVISYSGSLVETGPFSRTSTSSLGSNSAGDEHNFRRVCQWLKESGDDV